ALIDRNKTVRLWDVGSGREVTRIKTTTEALPTVLFAPSGKIVASFDAANDVIGLWDALSGKLLRYLEGYGRSCEAAAFSPDGAALASIGGGNVQIWDMTTGQGIRDFYIPAGLFVHLAFSPEGKRGSGVFLRESDS